MKPASDERREAAARLREDASCSESSPRVAVESYLGVEYDGADAFEESYKSESLLRLADLIDPTCRPEPCDGPDRSGVRMLACPECGLACSEGFWAMPDVRFCPRCGARCVMDGGED